MCGCRGPSLHRCLLYGHVSCWAPAQALTQGLFVLSVYFVLYIHRQGGDPAPCRPIAFLYIVHLAPPHGFLASGNNLFHYQPPLRNAFTVLRVGENKLRFQLHVMLQQEDPEVQSVDSSIQTPDSASPNSSNATRNPPINSHKSRNVTSLTNYPNSLK